ncbi:MAG: DUF883 family protein [Burkholderiales bacterium]
MEQTLDEFNRTKGKVVDDFKAIVNDAEALLQATAQISGEGFSAQRAKFTEKLQYAKTRLAEAEQRVLEKAKQAAAATDDYVHDNPWTAVGVAAAVGMLIGFLAARR